MAHIAQIRRINPH